jgi:hypothetical protein
MQPISLLLSNSSSLILRGCNEHVNRVVAMHPQYALPLFLLDLPQGICGLELFFWFEN